MAIAKAKFPIEEITGVLGKVDRSVGIAPGLAIMISKSPHSSVLSKKTKKTTTRSPAQLLRAKIYCDCDERWKGLGFWKQGYTCIYRKKVQQLSTKRYSWYLCWMSMCMADAWDERLFELNSYVSRYVIKNDSGGPWVNKKVTLIDIPIKYPIGWDVAVQETDYKRLPQRTLEHSVSAPGTALVCLPDMAPGRTIYIDVYSWGDYSTPQNCLDPWINLGNQFGETDVKTIESLGSGIAIAGTYNDANILRSADNGQTWVKIKRYWWNTSVRVLTNLGGGVAMGGILASGRMIRTTDYGLTWTDRSMLAPYSFPSSCVTLGGGIVLYGTYNQGYIFRSTDNGLTWINLGPQGGDGYITALADMGGGVVLAGTLGHARILRSTDYGLTWVNLGQQAGQYSIETIANLGGGIAVAGTGLQGHIIRSADNGQTWNDLGQQYGQRYIYAIEPLGNGKAYAGTGRGGKILVTNDYGLTWGDLGQQFGQASIKGLTASIDNVTLAGTYSGGLILRYQGDIPEYAPESTIKIGPT